MAAARQDHIDDKLLRLAVGNFDDCELLAIERRPHLGRLVASLLTRSDDMQPILAVARHVDELLNCRVGEHMSHTSAHGCTAVVNQAHCFRLEQATRWLRRILAMEYLNGDLGRGSKVVLQMQGREGQRIADRIKAVAKVIRWETSRIDRHAKQVAH